MPRPRSTKSAKYVALAGQIQSQIESGELRPGDRLPTFPEMCAQHDVTPTTISNVYALLKQERLIVCERGKGTFVAEPPKKVATGIIGIVDIHGPGHDVHVQHPYSARLMRGIRRAASRHGLNLLLLDETSTQQWEKMDGIIVHGTRANTLLPTLPRNMPAVVLGTSIAEAVCVVSDDRSGITGLMEHLLALGHRRVAAMLDSLSPRRVSAYRDALYTAGIEPNSKWLRQIRIGDEVEGQIEHQYVDIGHHVMQQWLREDWAELGCTAIITQNDDTAHGVVEALRQSGKRVPEDVSITGFDGTEIGGYFKPFLTTIEVPLEEMGVAVVEELQKQIAGGEVRPVTLSHPVSLKTCHSTAAAAGPGKQAQPSRSSSYAFIP
jgi:DNA-binding LacI/PurR family transcriptional regulator